VYRKFGKRAVDIAAAVFGILILSPFLIVIALLVRFKLGAPVIFRQARPGKDEKIFDIYKFRTMTSAKDKEGRLLPDEKRLTYFGNVLRKLSLDELPELWNILKGDMSLVGPRPLLPEYIPRYNAEQKRRHNVRPGLTGAAQVNGRNAISWEEKFAFDTWYVDNYNLWGDIKIILMTVVKVVKRQGITSAQSVTAEAFLPDIEIHDLEEVLMPKDLVIVGANGLGREVAWYISVSEHCKDRFNMLGYIDDDAALLGQNLNGYSVLGGTPWLMARRDEICAVICIPDADNRKNTCERLKTNPAITFPTIISTGIKLADTVRIGDGCILCPGALLTVNINIGDFVIVNSGCTISHDAVITDFANLYPGADMVHSV